MGGTDHSQSVLECINEQVYVRDLDKNILYINPAAEKLTGWTREKALTKKCWEVFGDENLTCRDVCPVDKVIQEKISLLHHEGELKTRSGDIKKMRVSISPLSENGTIKGGIVTMQDISEIKTLEKTHIKTLIRLEKEIEKRKRTEERFFSMFEHMSSGVAVYEVVDEGNDFIFRAFNPAAEKITRISGKKAVGKRLLELFPHMDKSELFGSLQRVWKTAKSEHIPPFHYEDGVRKGWRENRIYKLPSGEIVALFDDVTDRIEFEKALIKSEQKYRSIMETMKDTVYICTPEQRIAYMNPAMVERIGSDATGKLCYKALYNCDEECSWCIFDRVRQGENVTYELAEPKNDRYYSVSNSPILNTDNSVSKLTIFHDITDIKAIEAQLRQAQKMESVGRLAGGVAHDFNNMLSVILGNAEILSEDLKLSNTYTQNLQEIKKAAERSSNLTRQLLAFARKQIISPKIVDLNETIRGVLSMLQRLIGEDIELLWKPKVNLWSVKIDPSQIDQILANLCVNARDSIADIGKIVIKTDNVHFNDEYCKNHPRFTPGDYAMIIVSDTGHGMGKEELENLFEPFFTTKDIGEGTGIGLATVYGIVKQNEGFINVYSELNQGTTFKIYLPKYANKIEIEAQKIVQEKPQEGNETILLVEDEKAILKMTKMMLERLGYTVLATNNPDEALRFGNSSKTKIHLLMTDIVMPSMNGRELAEKILEAFPKMKCLYMSGYTADVIAHKGILDEGLNFINKPFSKRELSAKLRELLDGKND